MMASSAWIASIVSAWYAHTPQLCADILRLSGRTVGVVQKNVLCSFTLHLVGLSTPQ